MGTYDVEKGQWRAWYVGCLETWLMIMRVAASKEGLVDGWGDEPFEM